MPKIFVTGGSGFIGSNVVEYFARTHEVVNFDIVPPRNKSHVANWVQGDILNADKLNSAMRDFNPEYVIHLAARTDLNETASLKGYASNTDGVANVVFAVNRLPEIRRTIYASSRMVCRIDYIPNSFEDYCPPNLYGESKVIGEKIVRESASHDYVIVRPTSIWGPYFEIPYRTFFDVVRKNLFFLPKGKSPKKSFGFVYNTVFEIEKILFADKSQLKGNYYLTDYPEIDLKEWSDLIAAEFNQKKAIEIPMFPLRVVSTIGDVLKKFGWQNPPITSFRLNNLITNMVYDTTELESLCGKLPYNLNDGVKITTDWIKNQK